MDRESHDPVERAIRQAQEEGAFDDLPGMGEPIAGLDQTYDPAWWAKRWIERDRAATQISDLAGRIRREVPRAMGDPDPRRRRAKLIALNTEIDRLNTTYPQLPSLASLDVDKIVAADDP